MKIDVCFSPALYPAYHNSEAVAVVTDVFRATTTMDLTHLPNKCRSIHFFILLQKLLVLKNRFIQIAHLI